MIVSRTLQTLWRVALVAALLLTPLVGSPTPLHAQAADGNSDGITGEASVTDVLLS